MKKLIIFLLKLFEKYLIKNETKPRKSEAKEQKDETFIVKLDINELEQNLKRFQERRLRLQTDPPQPLPPYSIKTVIREKGENQASLSKYPVYRLRGDIGEDFIEAYINTNPKARIISFYINGPAEDMFPGRYANNPMFNIVTGEFRIVFEENNFMADAIKHWLKTEHEMVVKTIQKNEGGL